DTPHVDVRVDVALVGRPVGALGRVRGALGAEDVDGRLDVPAGLDQRGLAVHHPRAGALAKGLDLLCGRLLGRLHSPTPAVAAGSVGTGASAGAAGGSSAPFASGLSAAGAGAGGAAGSGSAGAAGWAGGAGSASASASAAAAGWV